MKTRDYQMILNTVLCVIRQRIAQLSMTITRLIQLESVFTTRQLDTSK